MAQIPPDVADRLRATADQHGLDVFGGKVRRSSSRFCLGVEHGDYNGTELFGVGTDRFIWLAYKPNTTGRVRLYSCNLPDDGLIDFGLGDIPASGKEDPVASSWARFPYGVNAILSREGCYSLNTGMDGVLYGNIPGGGMSRSASLSLNLILTLLEVNDIQEDDGMRLVDLAQMVENDYIGSPCGNLDQIMIYFARENMGTHYSPATGQIRHIPLGDDAENFRLVSLDTGTDRPGLEKSTYKIRREECEELVSLAQSHHGVRCLADVKTESQLNAMIKSFGDSHPEHIRRQDYIYHAQQRLSLIHI